MTPENKTIKGNSLEKLFGMLQANGKVIVGPRRKGDAVNFEVVHGFSEMDTDFLQTVKSAKEVVFPRYEKLFGFTAEKSTASITDVDPGTIPDVILWGLRPCDARGMLSLKALFTWDISDTLFAERMKRTTIIGMSCHAADEYCFCTSVGGGPGNTEGSDILLTQLGTGDYMAELITDKGRAIADFAPDLFEPEPAEDKEKFLADVPVRFSHDQIRAKLTALFDSDLWEKHARRCVGCGSCAFVCPVCACFDIQDEKHGKKGMRFRCWDSCGYSLFTLHTSGHNPRMNQHQRWRQRVMHKFVYMPERLSVFGCTGCGRCSRACPEDMNILEQLISIYAWERK